MSRTGAGGVSPPAPPLDQPAPPTDRPPAARAAAPGVRALLFLGLTPPPLLALVRLVMHLSGFTGVDAAAHAYKTELLRGGLGGLFWDGFWYGGSYGIIDYGPLYYLLAAAIPGVLLVVLAAGSLPLLLQLYLHRTYGATSCLPAAALTVVLCFYLANGQDPFLFALALMMGGLALLAYGRPVWAALAVGLALFCNPLAVFVGGVFLVADFVARADLRRPYLVFAAWFAPFAVARGGLSLLFAQPAAYFNDLGQVARPFGFAVLGAVLVWFSKDERRRHKLTLFLAYALVCVAAYALPAVPLGNNVNRFLMVFGLPVMLLITKLRLPAVVLAVALPAVAWAQLQTPASHLFAPPRPQAADAAFFAPALAEARALYDADYRFHVVALEKHWEAYYFPIHGYAITRGWYRQEDALHNGLFLRHSYSQDEYVGWLRSMGVRYVFLPDAPVDFTSKAEVRILTSSPIFQEVARTRHWTVYRLKQAEPLLVPRSNGGGGEVLAMEHRSVRLQIDASGDYLLKVTYTPCWHLARGRGEVARAAQGFVLLRARSAGVFELRFEL